MTKPYRFHKLPECDHCQFSTGNAFLPCTIHPYGVQDQQCNDFQDDPGAVERHHQFLQLDWVSGSDFHSTANDELQWEPEGAAYYNGELIITPVQRWERQQKEALLDYHPIFTGRCPACEMPLLQADPPRVHWDCSCGWIDDSV